MVHPTSARTGQVHTGTPIAARHWEATWGMPSPAIRRMEMQPELPSNLAWGQGGASLQHWPDPKSDPRESWGLTRNRQTDTRGRTTSHPALVYF